MSGPKTLVGPSVHAIPAGENRVRLICPDCGYIAYENPKIVVGAVCSWQSQILLCRRAIEPRCGFWTLPAGFLELNESTEEGARREVWEEARAHIAIDGLLAVYNIADVSQVQLIYRAHLLNGVVEPGPESAEVRLFDWEEIPWSDIAFPTVLWSLEHYHTTIGVPLGMPGTNPI
jgi:ADP-ribose pyrophosphatase YjhB (NUDIX family)